MKEILDKTTGTVFTNLAVDLTHIQCVTGDRVVKMFVNKVPYWGSIHVLHCACFNSIQIYRKILKTDS
jgi:hypothetical protein